MRKQKYAAELKKNNKSHFAYKDAPTGYALVAPAILLLSIFAYVPLIMSIFRAFQDYNTGRWNGWDNFDYIFKTPDFLRSFANVILFTVIIVVVMMVSAFFFATLLKAIDKRISNLVKVLIYVPCLISGIIASIVFMFLINYRGGLITSILIITGHDPIAFTTEQYWPIACVLVPTFWLGFGYNTIVMHAGLLNIPKSYYEAADIDGAKFFDKVFYITLPSLKNILILMLVNLITGTLQMMDVPYMITGGGPLNMTLTPSLYLFNSFRDSGRPQNATIAGSLLVMFAIVLINIIAFRLIRSKKSED